MSSDPQTSSSFQMAIQDLQAQLAEARETLSAIGEHSVDAIMVPGDGGDQVFTLKGADEPYRILVETMSEGAATLTDDGTVIYANHRLAEMLGVPLHTLIGQSLSRYIPMEQQHLFRLLLDKFSLGRTREELELVTSTGARISFLASYGLAGPSPAGTYNVILTDLSERKLAEEDHLNLETQLLQTQKLESLGILAGGIAHDFNNILTAILSHTELALLKADPGNPAAENLQRIKEAATRASELTHQLLAYTGKAKFRVEAVDLNSLLVEMRHLVEVSISKSAKVEMSLESCLPLVNADASQLHQVIMNLTINASEAIGGTEGTIRLSTCQRRLSEAEAETLGGSPDPIDRPYVQIEVADTGCGMSPETIAKIFDPFFTTKFTGRGLGMAAVHGIMKSHHGLIKVASEVGHGTTFTLLFPSADHLADGPDPTEPFSSPWQGEGRVLLVDDELAIRTAGKALLSGLGYQVLVACDGIEALEILAETSDIGTIILDLTMPRMGGEQTSRELKRLYPEIRVLISSGYSESEVTEKLELGRFDGFLQKPYDLAELKRALEPQPRPHG